MKEEIKLIKKLHLVVEEKEEKKWCDRKRENEINKCERERIHEEEPKRGWKCDRKRPREDPLS